MKSKINWLQGLGVLLISVLILGVIWNFTREEPKSEEEDSSAQQSEIGEESGDPYMITLRCNQTMEDPYNDLEVGESLYFLGRDQKLGEIEDLKLVDRQVEIKREGQYYLVTDPEDQWLEVRVKAFGVREPAKFMIGEVQLNVGQNIYPQTDECRIVATVLRIEKIEEEKK